MKELESAAKIVLDYWRTRGNQYVDSAILLAFAITKLAYAIEREKDQP